MAPISQVKTTFSSHLRQREHAAGQGDGVRRQRAQVPDARRRSLQHRRRRLRRMGGLDPLHHSHDGHGDPLLLSGPSLHLLSDILVITRTIYQNKANAFVYF